MKTIPIYIVDAFTCKAFGGNPAAVCLLNEDISDELKQSIAAEMRLSETAFVTRECSGGQSFEHGTTFGLRWFTPTHEVALCGHATLSTAAVLFNALQNPNKYLKFDTLSGILNARKQAEGITLDLPLNIPLPVKRFTEDEKLNKLIEITTCNLPVSEVYLSMITKKLLVRLCDTVTMDELKKISPPMKEMMETYSNDDIMGVIVTMKGTTENGCLSSNGKPYDFVSRYFAPWHGIDEDPVTGSAHTVLAGYWCEQLKKTTFFACQCSKRNGELRIEVIENKRVDLTGDAVIILQGKLTIP